MIGKDKDMKLIGMMDAFCVILPFVIIYMPQKV